MNTKEHKNSVPEEQFGEKETNSENINEGIPANQHEDDNVPKDAEKPKLSYNQKEGHANSVLDDKKNDEDLSSSDEPILKQKDNSEISESDELDLEMTVNELVGQNEIPESENIKEDTSDINEKSDEEAVEPENEKDQMPGNLKKVKDSTPKDTTSVPHKIPDNKSREVVNYSLLSMDDLVLLLEEYISNKPVSEIRNDVDSIKTNFYKKLKVENEQKLRDFISAGGRTEDFSPPEDQNELKFRDLLKKYRELRLETSRNLEDQKQDNLKMKYEIIEEIKELINSQESINKTFQDFRELQDRWRDLGTVPQASLSDLWETYHHHVEKFYDYIKINKELRDLDLKKNLEEKIILTEKTEALLLEPNIINAFKTLQLYHEEWREIGPVPKEKRSEIWTRFKEATAKVNKKHQQYYQNLKEQQKKNYDQKLLMCDRAEEIAKEKLETHQEWIRKTNEILELQKIWKTIGFAPRKENNEVYSRFRKACDTFFERKRRFYAQNMEEHNVNHQKKLELCLQAEALQESNEWKKATEELIRLQKQWKQIGPVPRKHSDYIWKRFRAACDKFFNRKTNHFKNIDTVYDNNLKLKEELISEVNAFKSTGDMQKDLEALQDFQRRWSEIGFVPIERKEMIQQKFRDAINLHFDKLDVDEVQKNVLKYESRLGNLIQKPRSSQKLKYEREKFMTKLLQLKSDISVYENNIGFFANSNNAEEMKRDFEVKIENTKKKIKLLEEKINLIDELDMDD